MKIKMYDAAATVLLVLAFLLIMAMDQYPNVWPFLVIDIIGAAISNNIKYQLIKQNQLDNQLYEGTGND